ncbi:hypothetical protein M427DRAFT_35457 [Gonapodya prolifera JEL478]|uniref:Alpha/beta hydrolase fold-3 domain-containing protein n=1 Tax=Gonapodya prolifera (strain JEL478) TaxID=1344416 RepID=A0A139A4F6_GONPJ|nr:hypothetical protein M427DRAFT_35457 [Gonapodya prolifera JEL478]|eukprot:KXS11707.1 hypothetical protein M427DRAFT_35457 [Gonapodya prolifera JEL478]
MSPLTHRVITTSLAAQNLRVLSVDYRMGPEHVFPAAVVDAVNAYRFVLEGGVRAGNVCLAGDSAGGGLTIATALYLRDQDVLPQVAGITPISPWIDLTGNSPTMALADEFMVDIIGHGKDAIRGMVNGYAPGALVSNTLASPILDVPKPDKKLPPCLASLATVDRLLGEDLAYSIKRIEAGETLVVDIYQDQFHVFQFFPFLTQTAICHARISSFIHTVTSGSTVSTAFTLIDYEGKTSEIEDGVADLRKRLEGYYKRMKDQGLDKGRTRGEMEVYDQALVVQAQVAA